MKRERIKIISKKQNIYYRFADITEWISNDGKQFITAISGKITYHVIDSDFDGLIFAAKGLLK